MNRLPAPQDKTFRQTRRWDGHPILTPDPLDDANGAGQYYATADLFEGVSCGTNDFDGGASLNITFLFVNACHARQLTVRNDREGGGDSGTITFRIEQDHQILIQRC